MSSCTRPCRSKLYLFSYHESLHSKKPHNNWNHSSKAQFQRKLYQTGVAFPTTISSKPSPRIPSNFPNTNTRLASRVASIKTWKIVHYDHQCSQQAEYQFKMKPKHRIRTHLIFDSHTPNLNVILTEDTRNWSRPIMYFTFFSWITNWNERLEHKSSTDQAPIQQEKLKDTGLIKLPRSMYVVDSLELYLEWKRQAICTKLNELINSVLRKV